MMALVVGKNSSFPRPILLLLIVTILGFLLIWFWVGMRKWFDVDESVHLHAAWLWSQGQVPYRDFFYFYSPALIFFLRPILFLGEGTSTLLAARALMWLVAAASIFSTFLLGKSLRNTFVGLWAALILAVLPVGLEKGLEIRPDNLATLFYLFGLLLAVWGWQQKAQRKLFASGVMVGLAVVTIVKMAFGPFALAVTFLSLMFKEGRKVVRLALWWFLGFTGAFLLLGLALFVQGVFSDGIYYIFQAPLEVFSAYGWYQYGPQLGFTPNMFLFGESGRGLPWLVNLLIWAVGLFWLAALGVTLGFGKVKERRKLVFFIGPPTLFFVFSILAVYNITIFQYFLPLLPLIALASADFLAMVLTWMRRLFSPAAYAGIFFLLAVFGFSLWQPARIKIAWGNEPDLNLVEEILRISNPSDTVFDMTGKYYFRPDAYFVCCATFTEFAPRLSRPLPDLIDSLIASQNKFILGGGRLARLSEDEQKFLEENYLPPAEILAGKEIESDYLTAARKISIAGKRISVSGSKDFFLIADGPYQIFWKPESISQISLDGRLIGPGSYQLSQGNHRVSAQETTEVTIIYDDERAKKIE